MIKNFDSIEEFKDNREKKTSKQEKKDFLFTPKIAVIGVGGSGTNAVNNLLKMNLTNIKFIVANTDVKSLDNSACTNKIRLGIEITKGLGAGSNPEIGFRAAEQSVDEISKALEGIDLLFLIAGMGGGTGTGSSSVITRVARELNILTLAFVTKPFNFEGNQRMLFAEQGIVELEKYVDSVVIMANQNLFKVIDENTSMLEAFRITDGVVYSGIKAISDLIVANGMVNLDFNDIKYIIHSGGKAVVTAVEVSGNDKISKITDSILNNPLIDDGISIMHAKNILISIAGGLNMTLFEVDKIIHSLRNKANNSTYINFGAIFDDALGDKIRVSVIATGIFNKKVEYSNNKGIAKPIKTTDHVNNQSNNNNTIDVANAKIDKYTDDSDNNPFNDASTDSQGNNVSNRKIEVQDSNNYEDSDIDLKQEKIHNNSKEKTKSTSLFNLIESNDNLNNVSLIPDESIDNLNNSKLDSKREASKGQDSKSFFELPPFLRQKK